MQYILAPKVYKAEIILLFWFLVYCLIHICGVNLILNVVAGRRQPGNSPRAVNSTNREVALYTKKTMYEKCVCPEGEEAKGSTSCCWPECLCTLCCKAAQLHQQRWEGIAGTSTEVCCFLRLVRNVNLIPTGLRPAHCHRLVWPSLGCDGPRSPSLSLLWCSGWVLWDTTMLGRALP